MDSDYPPLPRTRTLESQLENLSLLHDNTKASGVNLPSSGPEESLSTAAAGLGNRQQKRDFKGDGSLPTARVISSNGDVVIEYTDESYEGCISSDSYPVSRHRWQVASRDLVRNSPYFRVLLDPNKFAEGRRFLDQKTTLNQKSASKTKKGRSVSKYAEHNGEEKRNEDTTLSAYLPTVKLPINRFTYKLGVEVFELFLKILSLDSLSEQGQQNFYGEMRFQSPSVISRLVEVADIFNSPHAVKLFLKRCGYSYGKGKTSLARYTPSLLRTNEDRIRQMIFISMFLEDQAVFQVLTHVLIVLGSRFWLNGVGISNPDSPRWRYFQNGLEEELYYRRQCVLNTITDLQAFFLRAYGAMEEDPDDSKPAQTPPLTSVPSMRQQPRQFQCRWAFGDSSACDAFNLGQIIRFFSLRTKTIFLGSALIDPDFALDFDSNDLDHGQGDFDEQNEDLDSAVPAGPPVPDIASIIASLKQCPDYQIDSNHTGCGIRRRLLPALDCIERFVGDGRGLLGITLRLLDRHNHHHHNNHNIHHQHHHQYTKASASTPKLDPSGDPGLGSNLAPTTTSPSPPTTTTTTTNSWSWASRSLRKAHSVDIRFSKIISIHPMPSNTSSSSSYGPRSMSSPRPQQQQQQQTPSQAAASLRSPPRSPEEDARLFFTARKRNWEA